MKSHQLLTVCAAALTLALLSVSARAESANAALKNADGKDVGRPLVAVDSVGAGVGETVFFVRGKEASFPWHPIEVPADAGIVGIVDHYTVPK